MDWVFLGLCSLLVGLSILMVSARRPIISAIYLVLILICIGIQYLLLRAPFVATLQWLVYAGAIMVLFVFVVMLFQLREKDPTSIKSHPGKFGCAVFLGGAFLGLTLKGLVIGLASQPVTPHPLSHTKSYLQDFALLLFSRHVFVFELLSVVLLAALIGAIMLARRKTHV